MLKTLRLFAAISFVATPAVAYQCPYDMAKIDAALAANPKISASDLAKAKRFRAEGEALHKSGRTKEAHAAAVAKFAQAKRILGIQ
jgi:hypothetical protein